MLSVLDQLLESVRPLRERLVAHPIYEAIATPDALRVFMEHHVFAVWDFMALLKRLQRDLTSVTPFWTPTPHRAARRLVNEIVLAEESDDDGQGGFASHFEMYQDAMAQVGADAGPISRFVDELTQGQSVGAALAESRPPRPSEAFVRATMGVVMNGSLPAAAAAFTIGREDLIPDLFRGIVARVAEQEPGRFEPFLRYLDRHIEMDGDEHGPMALNLLRSVCGGSPENWAEATAAATQALQARLDLWDGVVQTIGGLVAPVKSAQS